MAPPGREPEDGRGKWKENVLPEAFLSVLLTLDLPEANQENRQDPAYFGKPEVLSDSVALSLEVAIILLLLLAR